MLEVNRRKRWKTVLMVCAVMISVFFLLFTNYLVRELSSKESREVEKIANAFAQAANPNLEDYGEILRTIQEAKIPMIVVDEDGKILKARNLDSTRLADTSYLKWQLRVMRFYNSPIPIKYAHHHFNFIYFKEQKAITLLRYFPYIQLMLIALFLGISYVAFNTSYRYEQNKVWVGMAKETAHQIGTPLSSLMAWVEYLKTIEGPPSKDVITDLEKDIERLEIITERFSKIGSAPELHKYNLYHVVADTVEYMKKRISGRVKLSVAEDADKTTQAMLNKNLFSWVIENLVRNAIDAGSTQIKVEVWEHKGHVNVDVIDNGKGILRSNFKTVFEPGFTTRKRGWGLGLSLSKRIIENYHRGEIYIRESEPGKGTTFRIRLDAVYS